MVKIIAQDWFDRIPNKDKIKVIGRGRPSGLKDEEFQKLENDKTLDGKLKIGSFPNLERIYLGGVVGGDKGSLTKVTITNCPNLNHVDLYNNMIDELDVSNLPNLVNLVVSENNLGGEIKLTGCKNLRSIITSNKENISEKWEGLEDLESLVIINSNSPFLPVKKLRSFKEITDPVKGLSNILNSSGVVDKKELEEYKKAKERPTQKQLDEAVENERNKFKDHIDPNNPDHKDKLKEAAKKDGFGFTQDDINRAVEQAAKAKRADLDAARQSLNAANQKIQIYETGLKTDLGLNDGNLNNWRAEIAKLKNRPISNDSNKIKAILGLPSTTPLPPNWDQQIVSKVRYDRLENYSNKQGTVIDNLGKYLQEIGMTMDPDLQAQIQQLPQFKP